MSSKPKVFPPCGGAPAGPVPWRCHWWRTTNWTEQAQKVLRAAFGRQLMEQDPRIDAIILGMYTIPCWNRSPPFPSPYIHLLSQGPVVAERLDDYLERHPDMAGRCSKTGKRTFFTTDDPASFNRHATIFFGESVASHHFRCKVARHSA